MPEILPSAEAEQAYILQKKESLEAALATATKQQIGLELELIEVRAARRGFDLELQILRPEVERIEREVAAQEKFGPAVEELKAELSPGGKRQKPVTIG